MKNAYIKLIVILMMFPIASFGEDFKVNISLMEAINQFNVLNVGSLAVGEKGLTSIYGLKTCVDNGDLKIASISELDSDPSDYLYSFEVSRMPKNKVSVIFSNKGKKPDAKAVQQAVIRVLASSDCVEIKKKGIPLFSVTTFLGAQSLKQLVSQSSEAIKESNIENVSSNNDAKIDELVSRWIVSESKSPIDDSPSVTMFRTAESGNQTLILRCKENSTDAFISTKDFLSKDKTNVTVRFDKNKANKQNLSLSTDNKALFFSSAISNIKTMMKSKIMVIRYRTYSGTTKTVTFKLDGLKDKISPLRSACHW